MATLLTRPIPSPAAELFVAINPPGFDKLPLESSQVAWGDYDNDGLSGTNYQLQSSANLKNWANVPGLLITDAAGTATRVVPPSVWAVDNPGHGITLG